MNIRIPRAGAGVDRHGYFLECPQCGAYSYGPPDTAAELYRSHYAGHHGDAAAYLTHHQPRKASQPS